MSLERLIDEAIRLALEGARDAAGGPFEPFVLTVSSSGGQRLTRLIGVENSAAAQEQGRSRAGTAGVTAYAIAFDSFLRSAVTGERFDAIVVEAGELGLATALVVGQGYRTQPFELIGDRVDLGTEPCALSPSLLN
jgi:hypothetical protein